VATVLHLTLDLFPQAIDAQFDEAVDYFPSSPASPFCWSKRFNWIFLATPREAREGKEKEVQTITERHAKEG
jgi:hypothetical protein